MSFLSLDRWLISTDWSGSFCTNASPVLSCMCVTLTPALALCITHHCSIFHSSCWANALSQWVTLIARSYKRDYTANGWFQRLYSPLISNRMQIWWKTCKNGLWVGTCTVGKQAGTHTHTHFLIYTHTWNHTSKSLSKSLIFWPSCSVFPNSLFIHEHSFVRQTLFQSNIIV